MATRYDLETTRGRSSLKRELKRCDMYAHTPTYDLPAFTSWCGVAATFLTVTLYLSYMCVTLGQYVRNPPELGLQGTQSVDGVAFPNPTIGLSVRYTDANGERQHVMPSANDDYFQVAAFHVTIQPNSRIETPLPLKRCPAPKNSEINHLNSHICLDNEAITEKLMLEGDYVSDTYKFIKVKVLVCQANCAISKEEIENVVESGVVVESVFYVQHFEVDTMGLSRCRMSERWYMVPGLEVLNEVYLLPRVIQHERRHWGSPPFPETETRLLDFEKIDSRLSPRRNGDSYMTFYFRLSHGLSLEETAYWMPSLLDLFGAWGAFASFLSTLSLGLVARRYNQYRSQRSFSKNVGRHTLAGDDIRLYEKKHFDEQGRLIVTPNELQQPSTAYGELRLYASREHLRKKKAAEKIISSMHSVPSLRNSSHRHADSTVSSAGSEQRSSADRAGEESGLLLPLIC